MIETRAQRERREGKERGGIIVLIDGDVLHRLWCGGGDGTDLLAAHVESEDGEHHLMGRVRLHRDERTFGSEDEKECFHFLTENPGGVDPGRIGAVFLRAISAAAQALYGTRAPKVHSFQGSQRPGESALDAMQRLLEGDVPQQVPGYRVSMARGTFPKEGGEK